MGTYFIFTLDLWVPVQHVKCSMILVLIVSGLFHDEAFSQLYYDLLLDFVFFADVTF